MSSLTGMEIFFKKDFLQYTGSFKERGARYALLTLSKVLKFLLITEMKNGPVFCPKYRLQFILIHRKLTLLNFEIILLLLFKTQKLAGVIAASAGNHAQALCYHGKMLKIPVVVVMPE